MAEKKKGWIKNLAGILQFLTALAGLITAVIGYRSLQKDLNTAKSEINTAKSEINNAPVINNSISLYPQISLSPQPTTPETAPRAAVQTAPRETVPSPPVTAPVPQGETLTPLYLPVLYPWSWATYQPLLLQGNVLTVSGISDKTSPVAGFVNEHIDTGIAGRTLVLEFANTGNSVCRFKLESDDVIVLPMTEGVSADNGYIRPYNGKVEYPIPPSFAGKLNFVFMEADIRGLSISTFVK